VDISCTDTGHSAILPLAYGFESEKVLNPANKVDPFYIEKINISQIVPFLGSILKKLNMLAALSLDLNNSLK
jgi:hypothetical protein